MVIVVVIITFRFSRRLMQQSQKAEWPPMDELLNFETNTYDADMVYKPKIS